MSGVDYMKKIIKAILLLSLLLILCSFEYNENLNLLIENSNTITNNLHFVVFDRNSKQTIEGVKLIVINKDGEVISILTTDKKGEVEKKVTVSLDKRYYSQDENKSVKRGTVTVLAFKKGYCDVVLFEVPVTSFTSYQPFAMSPVVSGQRNEPEVFIGNIHHLEIGSLVDKYREYLNQN
jgi:hypothetical protein